jgi:ATP phosphoribosyltransferase regulatory subunit
VIPTPWLLPDGIEESLPPAAYRREILRARLLDIFTSHGYQLIATPLIEYVETLLGDMSADLSEQTFKLVDPLDGRLLGVRADMTPQVARMDAHRLKSDGIQRLCYIGPVLKSHRDSAHAPRNPIQVGAEIFGHAGIESDIAIIDLALEICETLALPPLVLDLGHVGFFRSLVQSANLKQDEAWQIWSLLQAKDVPALTEIIKNLGLSKILHQQFLRLPMLHGDVDILEQAATEFPDCLVFIEEIQKVANNFLAKGVSVHIDLAELRGYRYKTGLVFTGYVPGQGQEVLRGGRYDGLGKRYGRDRPATGFSCTLNLLESLSTLPIAPKPLLYVSATSLQPPWQQILADAVYHYRRLGYQVIQVLPEEVVTGATLVLEDDRFVIKNL